MQRSFLLNIGIVLMVLVAVSLFYQKQTNAQTSNFYRVVPFSTPAGQLGFFDQQSGKLYLYDTDLKTCTSIAQLQKLGESLTQLK